MISIKKFKTIKNKTILKTKKEIQTVRKNLENKTQKSFTQFQKARNIAWHRAKFIMLD